MQDGMYKTQQAAQQAQASAAAPLVAELPRAPAGSADFNERGNAGGETPGAQAALEQLGAAECCGVQATVAVPMQRGAPTDDRPLNMPQPGGKRTMDHLKQEAILALQHEHDVEGVGFERGGGDDSS